MREYTREMHSKITDIEKKEKNFDTCFTVFGALFLFSPLFSIMLDTVFNQYIILALFGVIGLIGMYFSATGIKSYSEAVLKMVIGEEMKQFSDNPYIEFCNLVKNFKKEIREEGILEKDFDEAFYLRMKYFFENEFAEIIQKRKTEAVTKEELQRRKMEEQAEEGRKKMQEFSDKYSGNLELEKKS